MKTVATIETILRCFYIDYSDETKLFYVSQGETHRTHRKTIGEAFAVIMEKYIKNPAAITKIECNFAEKENK
jgi:hypothetical protein